MNLATPAYIAQGAAATLAVVLALRRREYRPVAFYLVVMTIADEIRLALRISFDLATPGPYHGFRRLAFHIESALFLSWPFGLDALCLHVLACRPIRLVAWLYASLVLVLTLAYPHIRGDVLSLGYAVIYGGALLVGAASIILWLRREEPAREVEHKSTVALLALTAVFVLGPFIWDAFASWPVSHIASIVFYVLLAAMALRALYQARLSTETGGPRRDGSAGGNGTGPRGLEGSEEVRDTRESRDRVYH